MRKRHLLEKYLVRAKVAPDVCARVMSCASDQLSKEMRLTSFMWYISQQGSP